ncbi:phosphoribosylglycinamide formyltransferase [Exilibacterium tricleocarpae]|uniref:Phosphoribosylglycinamide formyltransferase n=2 Tax=Exilibacterium tricleocarpae TaxID=2591008 RepID=A0A545UBH4_9GAMM|nr:phosphoribosylglycinamide formyltransferase [Exilibacterium tricleocarpae]TQV86821.1 phosphoribosylglycinamide formyltransferase [Exilibacterium tricleocarpae]
MTAGTTNVVVLISGSGTNLQALIDARDRGVLNAELCAVISNRPDAYGLQRAERAAIATEVLDHTAFASRDAFDAAMAALIDGYRPDLVVLAGFMRILTPAFVQRYAGRMLNIHPSLLPKYQGLHTHRRALEAGDREHGVTVHFVTEELDGGPAVIQARVPVRPGDTVETLANRVRQQEHIIYPMAVQWFSAARLRMADNRSWLDGEPLPRHGYLIDNTG